MDQQNIVIRKGTPRDAGNIAYVHVAAWQAAYRDLLPAEFLQSLSVEQRQIYWERTLSNVDSPLSISVAENDDDGIIGFVLTGPARDVEESENWGEVMAIYVLEHKWRQGVGWKLWQSALNELNSIACKAIMLWVLEGNKRAINFYEKVGFELDTSSKGRKTEQIGELKINELRYVLQEKG